MTRETENDAMLERLFTDALEDEPDTNLVARVLSDAEAVQREISAPPATAPVPRDGWLAGIVDALGGWGPVGGVTAAGLMGLSMGLYSPDAVVAWVGTEAFGADALSYEVAPDMTELWLEDADV